MPNISEGLRPLDLKNALHPVFEVDTFKSKMGEDTDVVTVTFIAKDRYPAKDVMEFVEKSYDFVLDADVSSGENKDGDYSIFIEIARTPKISNQIEELTQGIAKLTGINEWQFKYYKQNKLHKATQETLQNVIPASKQMYENVVQRVKTEQVKRFFNKTLMDDLTIEGDVITIHKPFGVKVNLKWLNENDPQAVVEGAPSLDSDSMSEIFWLTKMLGNYEIDKFGDKLLFKSGDNAMLLQRI